MNITNSVPGGLSVLMSRLLANRANRRTNPAKTVRGGVAPSAASGISPETDLSKLTRLQILELLKDAMAENERLKKELAETKKQLEDKRIAIDDSESLAEASLRLAGVFAAAQHAIDLYGYNVSVERAGSASGDGSEDVDAESAAAQPEPGDSDDLSSSEEAIA